MCDVNVRCQRKNRVPLSLQRRNVLFDALLARPRISALGRLPYRFKVVAAKQAQPVVVPPE